MQISQENYQEYLNMRNNAVNFLKEQPLKNNANVTPMKPKLELFVTLLVVRGLLAWLLTEMVVMPY